MAERENRKRQKRDGQDQNHRCEKSQSEKEQSTKDQNRNRQSRTEASWRFASEGQTGFFSGHRKLTRYFSLFFWLMALAVILLGVLQTVETDEREARADAVYGAWQEVLYRATPEQRKTLEDNPLIEAIGTQYSTGEVIQTDPRSDEKDGDSDEFCGLIGYADESFFEMASLQMKSGRMPESSSEIAAESRILKRLGSPETPGSSVELTIRSQDGELQTETYTLCGILEDYSDLWTDSESRDRYGDQNTSLLRILTASPTGSGKDADRFSGFSPDQVQPSLDSLSSPAPEEILFFRAREGYEDIIEQLDFGDSLCQLNVNRERARNPDPQDSRMILAVLCLAAAACTFFVLELLFLWMYRNRSAIRLLHLFGIRFSDFFLDVLRLLFRTACLPWIVCNLASFLLGISFRQSVLLNGLFVSLLAFMAVFTGLAVRWFQLSFSDQKKWKAWLRRTGPRLASSSDPSRWKRVRERFTGNSADCLKRIHSAGLTSAEVPIQTEWIASRLQRRYRGRRFSILLLSGLTEVICLFGLFSVQETVSDFFLVKSRDSDYILQAPSYPTTRYIVQSGSERIIHTNSNLKPIDPSVLKSIQGNEDLRIDTQYGWNRDFAMYWDDQESSLLYQAESDERSPDHPWTLSLSEKGDWTFFPNIYQISQPELIRQLQCSVSEGKVSWNQWMEGKEAILYLPSVTIHPGSISSDWKGKTDLTFKVGDDLRIEKPDGTAASLRLAGIIRDTNLNLPGGPYGIFIGGTDITSIEISLQSEARRAAAEDWLQETADQNHLSFIKTRKNHEDYEPILMMKTALIVFFIASVMVMGSLILRIQRQMMTDGLNAFRKKGIQIGFPSFSIQKIVSDFETNLMRWCMVSSFLIFIISLFILVTKEISPVFPLQRILWCVSSFVLWLIPMFFCMFRSFRQSRKK